jgi:rhodanese-related sulfurtransferase
MEFAEVRDGLKEKSFVLVDVRNPEELQAAGKIPGSVNVPREFPESRIRYTNSFLLFT